MWGNGWKSHARRCGRWLAEHGWPFADADAAALRAKLRGLHDTSEARLAAYRRECIAEARRRGLLDAQGRPVTGRVLPLTA